MTFCKVENSDVIDNIRQHPYFSSSVMINIAKLPNGLSHLCFKVMTTEKNYFVKYSERKTLSIHDELALLTAVSDVKLSPPVLYCDEQWLITDFIESDTLFDTDTPLNSKVHQALTLLTHFHLLSFTHLHTLSKAVEQHNSSILRLNIRKVIEGIVIDPFFTEHQRQLIATISDELIGNLSIDGLDPVHVFCHGDINFHNILCDKKNNRRFLIDFDCLCFAEVAFDLAMMIAVNELDIDEPQQSISFLIEQYQHALHQQVILHASLLSNRQRARLTQIDLSEQKVTRYLFLSLFINALWYLMGDKDNNTINFKLLAETQFTLLNKIGMNKNTLFRELLTTF
jgi:thiamine kinase-like enzyme